MPGPLTDRILDSDGRPTRGARWTLGAVALVAFVVAFVAASGSSASDPRSGPVLRDDPVASPVPAAARFRTAAPLPDLRREGPPRPAVAVVREPDAEAVTRPAATAPVAPAATPAPVAPAPAPAPAPPTPAPSAPPQPAPEPEPEPSFDSTGEFDSSG
jgi:hypothetical protein